MTGGHTKNPLLMELYADAAGCTVVEPLADEAVLLGTAWCGDGALASTPTSPAPAPACAKRGRESASPIPRRKARFDRDYRIFLEMHRQRQALDEME